MKRKPKLSIWQIINMSMGFMGIQMGFALQNANASRILQNFGADVHQLPWMWLVAPFMGLLIQPIVGHMGDNTWTKMGRRKPYFLAGAILAAFGLILLPNTSFIVSEGMKDYCFLGLNLFMWVAILFLAFMDGSFNISMEPFRALVGDMLPKSQASLGFTIQTILIGIGAVLGSTLPSILSKIGVLNEAPEGFVAPTVVYSFYIGAIVLLSTIIYTILTTKEYAPEDFNKYAGKDNTEVEKSKWRDILEDVKNMPTRMKRLGAVQFFSWFALFMMWVFTTPALATHYYGLDPHISSGPIFEKAGNKVGDLFGYYNFASIFFAIIVLIPLSYITSRKFVHFIALIFGGLGLLSMKYIGLDYLIVSMIGIGFAWASILAMPYALLVDSLPIHKMGIYMGIFNFFIVVPQIINGIISPFIVKHFFNEYAINMIVIAGISMLVAALLTLRIKEPLFSSSELRELGVDESDIQEIQGV